MNNRIKQIRDHFEINQGMFAKKLNVTQQTVSIIENGKRKPTDRFIKDVCRVYGVSETWLRTGEGEMFTELPRDVKLAAEFGRILVDDEYSYKKEIIETLLKFSDEELKVVFSFANRFMKEMIESRPKGEEAEDNE